MMASGPKMGPLKSYPPAFTMSIQTPSQTFREMLGMNTMRAKNAIVSIYKATPQETKHARLGMPSCNFCQHSLRSE